MNGILLGQSDFTVLHPHWVRVLTIPITTFALSTRRFKKVKTFQLELLSHTREPLETRLKCCLTGNVTSNEVSHLYPYHAQSGRRLSVSRPGLPMEGFHVHHKDGNKYNNTRDNLEILSLEEHLKAHGCDIAERSGGERYSNKVIKRLARRYRVDESTIRSLE